MIKKTDFAQTMQTLFGQTRDVFWAKNEKYGTRNILEAGIPGVLARLRDKLGRIERQLQSEDPSETLMDVGIDISNYGVILAALAAGYWPGTDPRMGLMVTGDVENIRAPAKDGDVGYDLCLAEDTVLCPGRISNVATGVRVKLPPGTWGRIAPRSSAANRGIVVIEGIIDNGYTGELFLRAFAGVDRTSVKKGERLAQLILHQAIIRPVVEVDELPKTERGSNGFGSTGT